MISVFEFFGTDPARFLKVTFELSLISLLLVCLAHSFWVHGWERTVRKFVAGFALTAACENIGVLSGAYVYPGFHFYVYATPFLNPASWAAVVYIVIEFTNRLVYGPRSLQTYKVDGFREERKNFVLFKGSFVKTILVLAVIDAALLVMVDLIEDPLATIYNWWIWVPYAEGVRTVGPGVVNPYNFDLHVWMTTPDNVFANFFGSFFPNGFRYPTRLLGIPLLNFIAWFLLVFSFSITFRWVELKEHWGELKKTLVLWSLTLVLIVVLPAIILWNL